MSWLRDWILSTKKAATQLRNSLALLFQKAPIHLEPIIFIYRIIVTINYNS